MATINTAYDVDSIEVRSGTAVIDIICNSLRILPLRTLMVLKNLRCFPLQFQTFHLKVISDVRQISRYSLRRLKPRVLADMNSFSLDLKAVQAKDIPLDKLLYWAFMNLCTFVGSCGRLGEGVHGLSVLARQQVELVTAQAWLSKNKDLEQKRKVSTVPKKIEESKLQKKILLQNLGAGFGNYGATVENIPPGATETRPETTEILAKAASNCCGKMCDICLLYVLYTDMFKDERSVCNVEGTVPGFLGMLRLLQLL
ncbi:hypothetical protein HAX54_052301 [Datura stramonium]|uniref:Uncharacterized protein n=1 Tax=Datura stramonium TaxID=4076 RepID=A0ABS8WT65_DATST|nr:hypothetical protein [Datura stramonium]